MAHAKVDGCAIASGSKHELGHVPWDVQLRSPLLSLLLSLDLCLLPALVVLGDPVLPLVHAPCLARKCFDYVSCGPHVCCDVDDRFVGDDVTMDIGVF